MVEKDFVPYIPPEVTVPELTAKAVMLGIFLSIVMAAANAYLGLYAGMTVSATIPAAVIALAVFRGLTKYGIVENATILETNLAKTMASAGESLAAGVIFTIPALLVLGLWSEIDVTKTTIIALVGGCLGVLFTISLRRVLIVDLDLPYPEGVAATEVLKTGEEGGPGVKYVMVGLASAMAYKFASSEFGLSIFREKVQATARIWKGRFYGGANLSPALMSVGYIVGLRIASYIFMGGILGWFILAPAIGMTQGWPDQPAGWIGPWDDIGVYTVLWSTKIRYIGVGAMVVGGIYSIFSMRQAITKGISQAFGGTDTEKEVIRTELDMNMKLTWTLIFLFVIPIFAVYLWVSEDLLIASVSSVVMLVAAFFFTAIAGYIAGLVGSSNNPISGVTVATALFAALLLVALGAEGDAGMTSTVLVAALVCCAAAIAGDVMQDLKTGQLLGATPRNLQIAEFIGVIAAALVIGWTLVALHSAYEIGSPSLPAPQAGLIAGVTQGVFEGDMPYDMVALGMIIAFGLIILRIPIMSVAIGIYLPFTLSVPIFIGGLLRHTVGKVAENHTIKRTYHLHPDEIKKKIDEEKEQTGHNGILFSSGLIAGEALMGVIVAALVMAEIEMAIFTDPAAWPSMLMFAYFVILLGYVSLRTLIEKSSVRELWDDLWNK